MLPAFILIYIVFDIKISGFWVSDTYSRNWTHIEHFTIHLHLLPSSNFCNQFWRFLGIYWKTKVWFSQIKPSPIRKTDLVKTQKNEGKSSFLVGAPLWDFCCIDNAFAKVLAHYTTYIIPWALLENNVDDWVEFYVVVTKLHTTIWGWYYT